MKPITLTQYLIEQQRQHQHISAQLRLLIEEVGHACKVISHAVGQGTLSDIFGSTSRKNSHGDIQKKLDILSNHVLIEANEWGGYLAAMASEEMETIHLIPHRYPQGKYLLLFDPLDGSSNIDVNVSIGTIFSVLKAPDSQTPVTEQDFLQPGRQQVAAGYAIYGPQTLFVLTTGHGVHGFTLNRELGTWVFTHHMTIPLTTTEFAINTSNQRHWHAPVARYIDELLAGITGVRQQDFNMRWIASMVADAHRILTRGGIFMYPADKRCGGQSGKLRLLYEANPMAFIVEQAQGAATNGKQAILDIQPTQLHQRVPVFLGSKKEVDWVTRYHLDLSQ